MKHNSLLFSSLLVVPLLLLSCGSTKKSNTAAEVATPRVEAARAIGERVVIPMRFQSLIYSNYDATIQPRVSGYLLTKEFSKGMPVKKGQVLFTLDSAPTRLAIASNRASLAAAKSALVEAESNYRRAVPLARLEAISQSALDQYRAAYSSAQAQVEVAQSRLDESLIQLDYATITSPISGIIDDNGATVGDWVGVGTSYQVLATVSNIDEVGVHIPIPFARYYQARGGGDDDTTPSYDNSTLLENIRLYLADGTLYPLGGTYSYTKREAGDQTGTIIIVASFPNPNEILKVGQSAIVVADVGSPEGVILIPQEAVTQSLDSSSVWVVRGDGTVEFRPVELGPKFGDRWIVESGLTSGEVVATTGLQRFKNGQKVIATIAND